MSVICFVLQWLPSAETEKLPTSVGYKRGISAPDEALLAVQVHNNNSWPNRICQCSISFPEWYEFQQIRRAPFPYLKHFWNADFKIRKMVSFLLNYNLDLSKSHGPDNEVRLSWPLYHHISVVCLFENILTAWVDCLWMLCLENTYFQAQICFKFEFVMHLTGSDVAERVARNQDHGLPTRQRQGNKRRRVLLLNSFSRLSVAIWCWKYVVDMKICFEVELIFDQLTSVTKSDRWI